MHNFLGVISMKFPDDCFNCGVGRIARQDVREHFMTSKAAVFVVVLNLLLTAPTIADATSYSVDTIAEGLLAAEAQFTDLRLDYVFTHRAWNKPKGPRLVVKAVYAQKMSKNTPKRLRYLGRKHSIVDPNTKKVTPGQETLASFDGQATIILYRKDESGKQMNPMKGYILAGYKHNHFPTVYMDPHTKIWYYHKKLLLGDFLKKFRQVFRIESESESLDGISTVKLVGTWADPYNGVKFTMKLWVATERNFLPLKRQIMRADGEMLTETALYDLVQLPNGMWYPKTIRSPADPPGIQKPRLAHIYNISKISTDAIQDEFFKPEFPPNTRVLDDILKVSYTTY